MIVTLQALTWYAEDVETDEEGARYTVVIFGRDAEGRSVSVNVPHEPYFFFSVPTGVDEHSLRPFMDKIQKKIAWGLHQGESEDSHLVKYRLDSRREFYGFNNGDATKVVLVSFRTYKAARICASILKKGVDVGGRTRHVTLYETNIDPVIRVAHMADLDMSGWLDAEGQLDDTDFTRCDVQVRCPRGWKSLRPRRDIVGNARFVLCSYDLEAYSATDAFPQAENPEDCVFQIASTFQRFGDPEPYLKEIVCLGDTEPVEDPSVVTRVVASEGELIAAWSETLQREQVDVLIGWNTTGFDNFYIHQRALKNHAAHYSSISKLDARPCELVTRTFSSGAYGTSEFRFLDAPGVLNLDLLTYVRREYKLESYKLDDVAERYLGEKKLDVSPKQIFQFYRGDARDRRRVAEYCVQDTALPLRLLARLAIFVNLIEMANVVSVPVDYLLFKGQQIKCFSLILKETRKRGFVVPVLEPETPEKFQGATVLEPARGFYTEAISALDFASLYPSIMRAHNLCHSTWVRDSKYLDLPGIEYFTMRWQTEDGERSHTFAKNVPGVLPAILENLAKSRKASKKDMGAAKDPFEKAIHNGKQLAYKVSMNSLYGFCGASNGYLPCKPVSETVTSRGRQMIEETKEFLENNFPGSKVVYGDSVPDYTPCIIRVFGEVAVRPIGEIAAMYGGNAWAPMRDREPGKEACELRGIESWTDEGWTLVHRVIRHDTPKRIVRVRTESGYVDVTEDHSLFRADGTKVSPRDLKIGDPLLHCEYPEIPDAQRREGLEGSEESFEGPLGAAIYCVLCANLGYATAPIANGSALTTSDGTTITVCKKPPRRFVTGIEEILYTGPVYDFTTDNHKFHAGVGNLVVSNTDSCYVNLSGYIRGIGRDATDMATHFEIAKEAADRCTKIFPPPNELEWEKCFRPLLLQNKKRYAGALFASNPAKPDYIDCKGIQIVRRDSCKFVKKVCQEILDLLMYDVNLMGARKHAVASAKKLLAGQVPMEDLVLSKSLRAKYLSDALPHVAVNAKREEREPGSGFKPPERVRFIYCDLPGATKAFEKAEDPEYARLHNIRIDYMYYLTNQLESPIESLLETMIPNARHALFSSLKTCYLNGTPRALEFAKERDKKQSDISSFFERKRKQQE